MLTAALTVARRVAGAALALVVGVLVAVVGAFHHPRGSELLGVDLPVGVLVGLAALVLALRLSFFVAGRAGLLVAAVAWLVVTTTLGSSRPEGDLVVPGDGRGAAYFWLGVLVCLGGVLVGSTAGRAAR